MPEKNIDFGKFGARGIKGSDAVARQLDELAGHIATPVTAKRGLMARLHYLTTSDRAWQAAKDAGLTVTDRTLKAWLEDRRRPSKANLERIDAAYRAVRRRNVARHLTRPPQPRGPRHPGGDPPPRPVRRGAPAPARGGIPVR